MIESVLANLTQIIAVVISTTGYLGVFVFMTAESALIPIPSEVIMTFSGVLVSEGRFSFWTLVLVGAAGNLCGSLLAYWLGKWGEETFIRELLKKKGKWLLLSVGELDRASIWFDRFGGPIVFLSRLLPVLRTFISLPAGIAVYPLRKFIPLTFFGSLFWSIFLAWLGVRLGNNWEEIGPYFRKFDIVIATSVIIFLLWFFYHKYKGLTDGSEKNPPRGR